MKLLFDLMFYVLIGIVARKAFGYKGIVETILWPLGILCAIYLKIVEEEDK